MRIMDNTIKAKPYPLFDTLEQLQEQYKQCQANDSKQIIAVWLNQCFAGADFELPHYAHRDYLHVLNFLYSYRGSVDTFNAYRRELERMIQWGWLIQDQSILKLKRAEIETFIEFCRNPHQRWIGIKTVSRFIDKNGQRHVNPLWRPFVVKVSKKLFQDGERAE